ncbi:MAG: YbaN family protein [Candidatus Limiplasma sp.]|nr:YbaN family protein [Candidatus Limiplasma sp.]
MSLKNILLTGVGFLLLAIAVIGLFLPVWPTTPFVLLAVACFSGNPKLQARLLRIRFIREHVENYRERKGLPRRNVVISLTFLWGMLILSMVLLRKLWLALLLAAIGTAVTIHILCVARPKPRKAQAGQEAQTEEGAAEGSALNRPA